MELGDPDAEDRLNRLDTMIYLQKEIKRNQQISEYNKKAYAEARQTEEARVAEINADYEKRNRERKLDNAWLINLVSGPDDAADYLAKHFRNEINRDPVMSYLVPTKFPHTLKYLL
jgi:hypothetical protein